MTLPPDFPELLSAFADEKASYLIVGGYAVAYHCEPRATKDIDLWLSGEADNVESATRALARFGVPGYIVEALRSQKPDEFVFMGAPPLRVDLLRTIPGVEFSDAFARRVDTEWHGVRVSILSMDDLLTAKRAAGRPQDLVDADRLEKRRSRTG